MQLMQTNLVNLDQIDEIQIDMDGVLADFEKRACELLGVDQIVDKKAMWKAIKAHIKAGGRFWYELEKMEYVDEMLDLIISLGKRNEILTATGYEDTAAQDKRDWISEHATGLRVNLVRSSKDKALYAQPNILLIDDRDKSIEPWVAAGGVGILHTDCLSTIRILLSATNDKDIHATFGHLVA